MLGTEIFKITSGDYFSLWGGKEFMKKRWDEAIDRGKPGMKSCNAWAISCLIHGTSLKLARRLVLVLSGKIG